jgi:hypothetical protein
VYLTPPTAGELGVWGMSRADWEAEQEPVLIWPEQEEVYSLFRALDTQWDSSFAGPTGFKYQVLPEMWRRLKIPAERRDEVFFDLQTMERAALEERSK